MESSFVSLSVAPVWVNYLHNSSRHNVQHLHRSINISDIERAVWILCIWGDFHSRTLPPVLARNTCLETLESSSTCMSTTLLTKRVHEHTSRIYTRIIEASTQNRKVHGESLHPKECDGQNTDVVLGWPSARGFRSMQRRSFDNLAWRHYPIHICTKSCIRNPWDYRFSGLSGQPKLPASRMNGIRQSCSATRNSPWSEE